VAIDPGRASAPRVAVPHILPSTFHTASAPTLSSLSWLIPDPTRSLCTFRARGRRRPRNARYQGPLRPTWAGLSPAGPHRLGLAHAKSDPTYGLAMRRRRFLSTTLASRWVRRFAPWVVQKTRWRYPAEGISLRSQPWWAVGQRSDKLLSDRVTKEIGRTRCCEKPAIHPAA
jgi:hypothetical protein